MALLQIDKMSHYFGGLRAVYNYDLQIDPGQIRGLIGPNGAGKTTIFNLITGIYNPTEGTISLEDKNTFIVTDDPDEAMDEIEKTAKRLDLQVTPLAE